MAVIREPEGIDFVVEPRVLTNEDRKEIAAHIRAHKAKLTQEEKEYSKAFTETVQAISRLHFAARQLQTSAFYSA